VVRPVTEGREPPLHRSGSTERITGKAAGLRCQRRIASPSSMGIAMTWADQVSELLAPADSDSVAARPWIRASPGSAGRSGLG